LSAFYYVFTHLSKLLEKVAKGEEIIISKGNIPVASAHFYEFYDEKDEKYYKMADVFRTSDLRKVVQVL